MHAPALPLFGADVVPAPPAPSGLPVLDVTVFGTPAVAGSKKGFVIPGTNRVRITDDSKKSKPWKGLVAQHAGTAMDGRPLLLGPLHVAFTFHLRRPKGHYGKRGIRPGASPWPVVRPDLLKRARAVEDALSGVVYHDDSQIVREWLEKLYGEQEGVRIQVWELRP